MRHIKKITVEKANFFNDIWNSIAGAWDRLFGKD